MVGTVPWWRRSVGALLGWGAGVEVPAGSVWSGEKGYCPGWWGTERCWSHTGRCGGGGRWSARRGALRKEEQNPSRGKPVPQAQGTPDAQAVELSNRYATEGQR